MVPSSDMIEAGRRFASDLRRIRELRGISADAVMERTKASPDLLEAFEGNALVDHPLYNRVYLRSFVRMYAEELDIDPEVALDAAEMLLEGRYDGSLAARYLGEEEADSAAGASAADDEEPAEPDETTPRPESESSAESTVPRKAVPSVEPPTTPGPAAGVDVMHAFEKAETGGTSPWVGRLKWMIPGLIVVILLLVWWLRNDEKPSSPPPPVPEMEPMPVDTSAAALLPPRVVLPDTLMVWVVAEKDTLNPVRLRIDTDQRRPFWIEMGDSMAFPVVGRISIEREMDAVALSVAGYRLPTSQFGSNEPIIYTRVQIQETLDSLRMM